MDKTDFQSVGADVTVGEQPDLPSWLSTSLPAPEEDDLILSLRPSKERKALIFQQFEMVFHRTLDLISRGYTLTNAVKELPIEVDLGAFLRWIKKDPARNESYKEAKEIRTESWAGKLVEYAEAADMEEDVQRSRLKVDTLKWLMAADNRRTYGDTKQIELGGSISITGALAQARARIIDNEILDVTPRLEES